MTYTAKINSLSAQYPFVPRQMAIDGHNLSYLDEGEGPVVVMLHGNPTWSFYYRNLALALKGSHRVIVPDHMGCGLSDKPRCYDYRLQTHIDNLERLLAHLRITSCSLVMHDWGGAIGMGYAVRHPERIKSFVVMNTAAFRSKRLPWRIRMCRIPWFGDLLVRGLNGFAGAATFMAVAKSLPRAVKEGYLFPYDSWKNRIAVLRFVQDIPLLEKDASWSTLKDIEAGLAGLQDIPMLLLWGGLDFCFTRYFFDEWRRRFPNARHRFFKDAGHYVLEDAAAAITPLVSRFLGDGL